MTSPVVLPATVVAALDDLDTDDFPALRGRPDQAVPGALPAGAVRSVAGSSTRTTSRSLVALSSGGWLTREQRLGERDVLGEGHLQVRRGAGHAATTTSA